MRRALFVAALALSAPAIAGCRDGLVAGAPPPLAIRAEATAVGRPPPWETMDPTFQGCGEGGCGTRGQDPDTVVQPGATIGDFTYCPVSGARFEVTAARPTGEVDGRRIYFCCERCAGHFMEHRDDVLAARGLGG